MHAVREELRCFEWVHEELSESAPGSGVPRTIFPWKGLSLVLGPTVCEETTVAVTPAEGVIVRGRKSDRFGQFQ